MKSWPLTEKQVLTFNTMVSSARKEKEESEDNGKRKMRMLERIESIKSLRERRVEGGAKMLKIMMEEGSVYDAQAAANPMMVELKTDDDDEDLKRMIVIGRLLFAEVGEEMEADSLPQEQ